MNLQRHSVQDHSASREGLHLKSNESLAVPDSVSFDLPATILRVLPASDPLLTEYTYERHAVLPTNSSLARSAAMSHGTAIRAFAPLDVLECWQSSNTLN